MKRVLFGRNAPGMVLSIVVLVVAAAGGAYAATAGSGKITVCVHKSDGGLY